MLSIQEYLLTPVEIEKELRYVFAKTPPSVIMDIGSCTGEDAIKYKNLFPSAFVIAFEPLVENIAVMKKHFQMFGKDIKIENFALSDTNGVSDFFISGGNPCEEAQEHEFTSLMPKEWNKSSSLLPPSNESRKLMPWLKFDKKRTVKTVKLETYMKEENIQQIDFMHLDVQGAELKVLKGMGAMISRLKVLWLEVENVELYEHQPLKKDLNDFLNINNFQLVKDTSKDKITGDCLYINKSQLSPFKRLFVANFL